MTHKCTKSRIGKETETTDVIQRLEIEQETTDVIQGLEKKPRCMHLRLGKYCTKLLHTLHIHRNHGCYSRIGKERRNHECTHLRIGK